METTTEPNPAAAGESPSLYAQVDQYPWDTDEEFQSGLTAILGTNTSAEQAAELTLRARCFYYSRKFNTNVDFDTYKAYLEQTNSFPPNGVTAPVTTASSTAEPTAQASGDAPQQDAPYPMSFAHIVELIQTGQPIPGIKDIPPTVLEGQGTAPAKAKRKKPWEKDEAPTEAAA